MMQDMKGCSQPSGQALVARQLIEHVDIDHIPDEKLKK